MHWTVITANTLERVPWRNGLGTSRTILNRPGRLHIGIADLLGDADFSDYSGFERVFTPLAGAIALAFDGGAFEPCPILQPRRFAGEAAIRCQVTAPGQAFNVVTARRHLLASVQVLTLEAGDPIPAPDAPEVLIHCLAGELAAAGDLLQAGDSLLGPGPAQPGAVAQNATAIIVALRPPG